jgi:acetylornithine deacetylase/succinyl-diaminopimelate desuccinylase-like protein
VVQGGLSRNTVPDACLLYAGRRLVPGEPPDEVAAHLLGVARAATDLDVSLAVTHAMPAVHRDPTSALCARFAAWTDRPPAVSTLGTNAYEYGDDVARDLIVFGPGEVAQAHAVDEWCAVDQLGVAAATFDRWLAGDHER